MEENEFDYEEIIFERFIDEVRGTTIKYHGKEIKRIYDLGYDEISASSQNHKNSWKIVFEDESWVKFTDPDQFLKFICNCVYVEG